MLKANKKTNLFRYTMEKHGLSVTDVCNRHKLSRQTVRDWVSGRRTAPQTSALEIPYYWGFSRKGNTKQFRVIMLGHRTKNEIKKTESLTGSPMFKGPVKFTKCWANYNPIVGWTLSHEEIPGYFRATMVAGSDTAFATEGLTQKKRIRTFK